MVLYTYVWETDEGPSLGPICTSEEAAMDALFAEYEGHYGTLTREEFDGLYEASPKFWVVPLEGSLQFVIDALQEKAAECDENLHRMMLECWGETQEEEEAVRLMTREQLAESWHRAYQARCEGPGYIDGEYQAGLSGEDYETIDNSEGFDSGMHTAITVIRELAGIAEPTEEVTA